MRQTNFLHTHRLLTKFEFKIKLIQLSHLAINSVLVSLLCLGASLSLVKLTPAPDYSDYLWGPVIIMSQEMWHVIWVWVTHNELYSSDSGGMAFSKDCKANLPCTYLLKQVTVQAGLWSVLVYSISFVLTVVGKINLNFLKLYYMFLIFYLLL